MDKDSKLGLTILGCIFLIGIVIIIEPFLVFWFAYFSGWIAKLTIGNVLCKSLALIGLNILPNQIPLLAGCLGWIGGFFHSIASLGSNKKN